MIRLPAGCRAVVGVCVLARFMCLVGLVLGQVLYASWYACFWSGNMFVDCIDRLIGLVKKLLASAMRSVL
jgi:hypothetical protein